MRVWVAIEGDEYELIYAIADSTRELAKMLGISHRSIYTNRSRARKGIERERYIPVDIPEDDEEV